MEALKQMDALKNFLESWQPTVQIEATDATGVTLVESLIMIAKAIQELAHTVREVSTSVDDVSRSVSDMVDAGETIAQVGREISGSIDAHS